MEHTIRSMSGIQLGKKITGKQFSDVCLESTDILRLDGDHRDTRITCLEGTLWVTQQSDPEDHLLQAYQTFTVTHPGTVLVQALDDGKARILPE